MDLPHAMNGRTPQAHHNEPSFTSGNYPTNGCASIVLPNLNPVSRWTKVLEPGKPFGLRSTRDHECEQHWVRFAAARIEHLGLANSMKSNDY